VRPQAWAPASAALALALALALYLQSLHVRKRAKRRVGILRQSGHRRHAQAHDLSARVMAGGGGSGGVRVGVDLAADVKEAEDEVGEGDGYAAGVSVERFAARGASTPYMRMTADASL
jgi:hypothetical protein